MNNIKEDKEQVSHHKEKGWKANEGYGGGESGENNLMI